MANEETGARVAPPQGERKSEVRIHIDHKSYDSPDPTTGEALYALAQVAEGVVLVRDAQGEGEDAEIANGPEVVDLRPGEQFHTAPAQKKDIAIIVNGRQRSVPEKHLSFLEIVGLAFDPVPSGPNVMFTVSFWNGPRPNPEGTMLEGSKVKIQEGMVFNVTQTDKS